MIYHIQMAVKRQPEHFTIETMMQLNETDAKTIVKRVGNSIVDENGKSMRVAENIDSGSEFIIPVGSLQPYFDRTPSTSQELCTLLEEEKEQKCKLWNGLVNKSSEKHLFDKTLSELCVMMLNVPSFSSSKINLYLYSKSGRVVHITYGKNKNASAGGASAASPFRPKKSQRSRSKSPAKRRNLKKNSKSKSKKRSQKPRR